MASPLSGVTVANECKFEPVVVGGECLLLRGPLDEFSAPNTSLEAESSSPSAVTRHEDQPVIQCEEQLAPANFPTASEDDSSCLAFPITHALEDRGKTLICGRSVCGTLQIGEAIVIIPSQRELVVEAIYDEGMNAINRIAFPGQFVQICVSGIPDTDVRAGDLITKSSAAGTAEQQQHLRAVEYFQARLTFLSIRNIVAVGRTAVMHIHTAKMEATIHALLGKLDPADPNKVVEKNPHCVRAGDVALVRLELERPLAVMCAVDSIKLGSFELHDEGRTIARGTVTKLYDTRKGESTKK